MGGVITILIVSLILGGITFFLYKKRSKEVSDTWLTSENSFDKLELVVLKDLTEIIKIDRGLVYKDVEYEASRRNKERVAQALRQCVYGEENSRAVVIATIREVLTKHLTTLEQCNLIKDFTDLRMILTPEEKFELLLYELMKTHKRNVFKYLNSIYEFSEERTIKPGVVRRELDFRMVDIMFDEQMPYNELNYEQALDMLSLQIYQRCKGYGKIDTLMTLNIDGIELGTSGSIRYKMLNTHPDYVVERSCWVQIDARWIHLSFIDFGSVDEIRRLVLNVSNVEGSEALTVKKPLKVVDSWNGNRITCIREGVGATYGMFIRSFSAGITSVEDWLDKPDIQNWQLVAKLLKFLALSEQNTAFTGQQNTGKTTLMRGFVDYYPNINIRVLEMAFELNLNELYPGRNLFCTKPTAFVSETEIQSILKKTDSYLSLVGEVASDEVAANMIQFGLVGSSCTIFSHHGVDYKGLIDGLKGSLLASGVYSDERAAQGVVLDVVKHNVHLDFHRKLRVVEYIEEIVKGERLQPYPEIEKSNTVVEAIDQSTRLNKEHYQRKTDRIDYTSRKIIVFNKKTNRYEPNQWYSLDRLESMLKKMPEEVLPEFFEFYEENWGSRIRKR